MNSKNKILKIRAFALIFALVIALGCLSGCDFISEILPSYTTSNNAETLQTTVNEQTTGNVAPDSIPAFTDLAYISINGGVPYFTDADKTTDAFEIYGDLDSLGRCGVAYANVCKELMPTEERGSIGSVKPSGWQSEKYDIVEGKYLYNRCHLIGFQLTAENANVKNLITGTRYLNIQGMLSFENMVADYVKETDNHVLYRVTPLFDGNNLVATGVLMEGYSVEDDGDGISFCVYCYNNQPGIVINYTDGTSRLATDEETTKPTETTKPAETTVPEPEIHTYILNNNSKKFHKVSCGSINSISEDNYGEFTGTREEIVEKGYLPCGICKP